MCVSCLFNSPCPPDPALYYRNDDLKMFNGQSFLIARVLPCQAVSEVAKAAGIVHVCDSTFATPLMTRPIQLGADMTLQVRCRQLATSFPLLLFCYNTEYAMSCFVSYHTLLWLLYGICMSQMLGGWAWGDMAFFLYLPTELDQVLRRAQRHRRRRRSVSDQGNQRPPALLLQHPRQPH